ncbi:MAG: amidase family protein [Deinococcales bacterium]
MRSYLGPLDRRDRFIAAFERFFERWDALISPISMGTAFPHCQPGTPHRVDGEPVEYWATTAHGSLFTYTDHPAIAMPHRLDSEGLPMGFQLVGRRWGEAKLLALAQALAPPTSAFVRPPLA